VQARARGTRPRSTLYGHTLSRTALPRSTLRGHTLSRTALGRRTLRGHTLDRTALPRSTLYGHTLSRTALPRRTLRGHTLGRTALGRRTVPADRPEGAVRGVPAIVGRAVQADRVVAELAVRIRAARIVGTAVSVLRSAAARTGPAGCAPRRVGRPRP
jgi:hypothetical protein